MATSPLGVLMQSAEKLQNQIDQLCEILEVDNLYNAIQKSKRMVADEKLRGRMTKTQKKSKAAKLAKTELAAESLFDPQPTAYRG
jgi:translation initiation factor 2 alpha subunit (eIF-2alpha)